MNVDTRVESKNLHGGEETNHDELEPTTKLEIKNQNQGCGESINDEEAKETNMSGHSAKEVIEDKRNRSMSMEEEDVRDRKAKPPPPKPPDSNSSIEEDGSSFWDMPTPTQIPPPESQMTLNYDPCMVFETEVEMGIVSHIQSIDVWAMVNVTLETKTRVEKEVVLLPHNINSVHEPTRVKAEVMSNSLLEPPDQDVCMGANAVTKWGQEMRWLLSSNPISVAHMGRDKEVGQEQGYRQWANLLP
ncbi:hypothetical protein E2542_SST01765 [Spatholobus suberectus]|nr:hypothetical protein E2542_SST01765 [Spatholobus suberectus]